MISPACDLAVDDVVEHASRRVHPAPRGTRAAHHPRQRLGSVVAERALEMDRRLLPCAGVVGVETEQRAHRHTHRQLAGAVVDVDHLAGPPGRDHPLRLFDHGLDGKDDLLTMERRQHDPPGAAVIIALDCEQAVAQKRDHVAEMALAPVEVVGVGDGDVVVGLGTEHEDLALVERSQAEDRAVLLVAIEQEVQRVDQHLVGAAEAEARRPRRNVPLALHSALMSCKIHHAGLKLTGGGAPFWRPA